MSDEYVEMDGAELEHRTDEAVLLDVGQDEPVWVPRSVCYQDDEGTWFIAHWFAYENGLI